MAITWGAYAGSPLRFRIGVEITSVSSYNADSGSTTIGFDLWFNTPNTISYNNTVTNWSVNNGASGSITKNLAGSNFTTKIGSASYTLTFSGSWSTATTTISASLGGLSGFTSGTATVSLYRYLGWATPKNPTGATVTRYADDDQRVAWTNHPTNAAPYKSIKIYRWDQWKPDEGYKLVATLSGAPTAWSDFSTGPNSRYQYGIYAANQDHTSSGAAWTSYISTTPAAPTGVSAAKNTSGGVVVSWTNRARMASSTEIQRSAGGGAWTTLASPYTFNGNVAGDAYSWTDTAPSVSLTNRYRVRHFTYDENPRLYSGWAESNTVQLITPPAAPTDIGPLLLDPNIDRTITWTHNPIDTSAQTAYEIQHRPVGGTWTSTAKITSTVSGWELDASYVAPGDVEIQIRTWGAHADPSPWSATATLDLNGSPSATILTPDPASPTVNRASLLASHAYFDPEGTQQSTAQYQLVDSLGATVETLNIDGPSTTATLESRLADQSTYTFRARVQDGAGLWSPWAEQQFTVTYLPPADPPVTAGWDQASGAIQLAIGWAASDGVTTLPMVSVEIRRGGVLVADVEAPDLPGVQVAVIDPIPPTVGAVTYTITAWSDVPSSSETSVIVHPDRVVAARAWWNSGPAWTLVARAGAVTWDRSQQIAGVHQHFAGRTDPVTTYGEAVERTISVSGRMNTTDGENPEALGQIAVYPGNVCYRDPRGRVFARITGHNQSYGPAPHLADISVSMAVVENMEA